MTGVARGALAFISILFASHAAGQVSAQVSIASDNEFRGNSLSDDKPVASIDVNIDSSSGWFAGGLLSEAQFGNFTHRQMQMVADAGYAHAIGSGISWEAGVTSAAFADSPIYNYTEIFAGLASQRWTARMYYSADYYGRDLRTVYAELNYSQPITDRVRLLAHVGVLHSVFGVRYVLDRVPDTSTVDARIGANIDLGRTSLQVSWSDTNRVSYLYPAQAENQHRLWFASLSYPF